jgi:hypothetical protein
MCTQILQKDKERMKQEKQMVDNKNSPKKVSCQSLMKIETQCPSVN